MEIWLAPLGLDAITGCDCWELFLGSGVVMRVLDNGTKLRRSDLVSRHGYYYFFLFVCFIRFLCIYAWVVALFIGLRNIFTSVWGIFRVTLLNKYEFSKKKKKVSDYSEFQE